MEILTTLLLLVSQTTFAKSSSVINCEVSNQHHHVSILLDAVGRGSMTINTLPDGARHHCPLKLESISDRSKALLPNLRLNFSARACAPEIKKINGHILNEISLLIKHPQKNPIGYFQWLNNKQPDKCAVKKLSLMDIALNAKKWNTAGRD